ncbi:ABC transporter substrate-binding protein [Streptomyces sp. VRA16 Mangrove soil]|uniref:sugar ABC transporter substrate-binding protein n=1 Tax=Streptomyces sp. VRA16 Mangrove soil TaxID=2817434 RepID=UPI001A9F8E22|nr:ABC transporter substrate-binding protein [Streptomyces sp. VRA16 Mangrove soil]MBO1336379.1 ABC transporter substrate-binding protein [Streptomyces sp. VRA16 Mangrove soil]
MTAPHSGVATPHGRRRTTRRFAVSLAVVGALVGTAVLSGCSQQRDENVYTVLNSSTDESFHSWDAATLSTCSAQLGVKIEQQSVPASQVMTKSLRMASSKSLPDIIQFDASEVPQFAEAGGLIPLKDAGVSSENVSKSIVDFGSYKGTWYGAARSVNTLALFYNKDILDKAGVQIPTTWDELRDAAKKLTSGKQYGLALSAGGAEDGVFQFLPFMWSNGGDEEKLDTENVAGALDYWKSLLSDGSLSKSTVNWTQADVNDQFMAGNAAMMVNGPWQLETLNKDKGLNYGIATIPVPKTGDTSVAPMGGAVLTVANTGDSAREKTAAKIINCMTSEKQELTYAINSGMVPANENAAKTWREKFPELSAISEQILTGRSRTGKVGDRWPTISLALQSAFQQALTGKSSSEAALNQAQQRATSGN